MSEKPASPDSGYSPAHEPVAYDHQGRPLYTAPPSHPHPPVVHVSRAVDPVQQPVTPEVKARHEQSVRDFPTLNLSDSEYIISAIRRHPIGLVIPVGVTIFLVAFVASVMINFSIIAPAFGIYDSTPETVMTIGGLLILLFLLGGYIAVWIYINNKFFLTNESVIQEIQVSLFSKHEQTVSLSNIEDASYRQQDIIQTLFNYGSIRLSTEGDETTYRFNYVSDPKRQIAILNNAVEAFKMGRPVAGDD